MYNSSKSGRPEGRSRKPFNKGASTTGGYKASGYKGAPKAGAYKTTSSQSADRRGGFKAVSSSYKSYSKQTTAPVVRAYSPSSNTATSSPTKSYGASQDRRGGFKRSFNSSRPQRSASSSYRGGTSTYQGSSSTSQGSTSSYRSASSTSRGSTSPYRGASSTSRGPNSSYRGSGSSSRGAGSYSRGGSSSYSRGRSSGGRPSYNSGDRGGKKRFQGKYISTDKFINKNPKNKVEDKYTPTHTFADFGFDSQIIDNLTKKGYTHPTRIQDESIPPLLLGRNVIGLANTGSGKTAAFLLPIIQKLKNTKGTETALIVAPTRELANQIEDELKIFSQGMRIFSALCVGGMSISFQKRQLSKRPQIIIGTPGRLKDLFNQRALNLKTATFVVLDEADRMLDMGFLKDIEFLISQLSTNPQALCFSATITPDISRIIDKIFPNPVTISARTSESGEHIAQDVIKVTSGDHKIDQLLKMLAEPHFEKVLIFGEMKHSVQKLADTLTQKGFPSEAIHGNKTQAQRNRSLAAFKSGRVNVLVATDVAARGLDIPNVSHVINFDKPHTYEDYIHRIGRTGRAGKDGQAYTFIHD